LDKVAQLITYYVNVNVLGDCEPVGLLYQDSKFIGTRMHTRGRGKSSQFKEKEKDCCASQTKKNQPVAAAENVKTHPSIDKSKNLEFCFYVLPRGTAIRVGSFYNLSFAPGSVFVCTQISKTATEFTLSFVLGTLLIDKVNSLS